LQARLQPTRVEPLKELLCNARHLAFSANIRVGRQRLTEPNTLAYYDTAIIMSIKSFTVQDPVWKFTKLFMVVA